MGSHRARKKKQKARHPAGAHAKRQAEAGLLDTLTANAGVPFEGAERSAQQRAATHKTPKARAMTTRQHATGTTVKANRFVLLDDRGAIRALLMADSVGTHLLMFDGSERLRVRVGVENDGYAGLDIFAGLAGQKAEQIRDGEIPGLGETRSQGLGGVDVAPAASGGTGIAPEYAISQINVAWYPDGGLGPMPVIALCDPSGKVRLRMGVAKDGGSWIGHYQDNKAGWIFDSLDGVTDRRRSTPQPTGRFPILPGARLLRLGDEAEMLYRHLSAARFGSVPPQDLIPGLAALFPECLI